MSPVDGESCFLGWREEGEWQAPKNEDKQLACHEIEENKEE